jgi:transmembrane sensor
MNKPDRTGASPDTEAADWYARLSSDECTPEDRACFDVWCAEQGNLEAFIRTEATLALVDVLQLESAAVLALKAPPAAHRPWPHWRLLTGAAAAMAAAVAIVAAAIQMPEGSSNSEMAQFAEALRYESGPGEIKLITLPDRSAVHISSDSTVSVRYTPQRREIILEQGQAYFEVAQDPARPFEVRARSRSVVAIGTAFDVRLDADRVEVTLVEGRVAIGPVNDSRKVTLRSGERYSLDGNRETVTTVDALADTAWRSGMLQFGDVSLDEAVERFNRHSARRLHLNDEALAVMRIGGRFRTNDADAFADALEALYPIRREKRANGDIELYLRRD